MAHGSRRDIPRKKSAMKIKMMVVKGKPKGKCLTFPKGEFLIGRGEECHVRPESPWVSRQHCLLQIGDSGSVIRDLGSRNGTLINGKRVSGVLPLTLGDKVQIGPLVLEVVEIEPPSTPLQPVTAMSPEADPGT